MSHYTNARRRPVIQRLKHTLLSRLKITEPKWVNLTKSQNMQIISEYIPQAILDKLQTKKVKQVPDFIKVWNSNCRYNHHIEYVV
jgi:hypothetical protein